MSAVEKFPVLLSEAEEESSAVPPCFSHEGINVGLPNSWRRNPLTWPQYLYIRHNNLYLLALTKRNTNAAEILLFLHKVVEVEVMDSNINSNRCHTLQTPHSARSPMLLGQDKACLLHINSKFDHLQHLSPIRLTKLHEVLLLPARILSSHKMVRCHNLVHKCRRHRMEHIHICSKHK